MMLLISIAVIALSGIVGGQRPSSSYRSDVYIAGFFPYGDGVENAATGKCKFNQLSKLNSIFNFCIQVVE